MIEVYPGKGYRKVLDPGSPGSEQDLLEKLCDLDESNSGLLMALWHLGTNTWQLAPRWTEEDGARVQVSLSLSAWTAAIGQLTLLTDQDRSRDRAVAIHTLATATLIEAIAHTIADRQGVSYKVAEAIGRERIGIRPGHSEIGEGLRLGVLPFLSDQAQDCRTFTEDRKRLTKSLQALEDDDLYAVAQIVLEVASEEVE
jgi:hypothetical protein